MHGRTREPSKRAGAKIQSRHGFALLELMAWVGMLGIVAAVVIPLFRTTFRILHGSAATQSADIRQDLAIAQLRRDAWGAESIDSISLYAIQIRLLGDEIVEWKSDPASASLTRRPADARDVQRWDGLGKFEFATEGPSLTVRTPGGAHAPESTTILVSQKMLLDGRTR